MLTPGAMISVLTPAATDGGGRGSSLVLLTCRASFLSFWKHAENTQAGGTRLRCPLYSGHRNRSSSLSATLKRMVWGREDACHCRWNSGVAVWVSFRCRLGGRKLHLLLGFRLQNRTKPCTSPHQIPLRFRCRLGAV